MNNPNEQRAQGVKKAQPLKSSAQPPWRRQTITVMFAGWGVRVPMKMHAGAMFVEVGMFSSDTRMRGGKFLAEPFLRARKVKQAEKNKHQAHGEFHAHANK